MQKPNSAHRKQSIYKKSVGKSWKSPKPYVNGMPKESEHRYVCLSIVLVVLSITFAFIYLPVIDQRQNSIDTIRKLTMRSIRIVRFW